MGLPDIHSNFNFFFDGLHMRRQTDNRTEWMKLEPQMGEGSIRRIVPRADLGAAIAEFRLHGDRVIRLQTTTAMVELSYCLEGAREIQVSGAKHEVVPPGSFAVQFVDSAEADMHFSGGQSFRMISIGIPVPTFHRFMEEVGGTRSVDFNRIIGRQSFRMFRETIDPASHILLLQMMNAEAGMRNLEVEYKILELMSRAFRSFHPSGRPASTRLSRSDMAKIAEAREIMLARMTDPPSLLELSRFIGLNDNKLKFGFKEMYGTTLFGYLKEQRLETAYHLLQNSGTSVIEAALAVGYSNPGYFAEAFRNKFGINPGAFIRRN
ncbi:helix-turn-helix transcriptional regulator [Paenibacillus nasutitermitis]|uniref:AraC family transcriptional regulator n=1 Tax=Paenibacillus nasutitermitis TaxID=1652958 RepID=A0A916ZB79_9BACL|nr:AraC family transcriptional regulator [Paenibacillus nasutitermitis]GGD84033.1 AraC family transcriptional regulator [Paenibacillus nasutitermitis]